MKKIYFFKILLSFLILANLSYTEPRRVLLEYCTGTWCGYCPCGHQAIDHQIIPAYPNTIFIAYHGGASSDDPWKNFEGNSVRSLLGFSAYPTGIIDRGNTPNNPYVTYDMWFGKIQTRYNASANTQVNLAFVTKAYNSSTRELSATINATALQSLTGQYKIQFVIIENNVIYQQNHYASCGYTGYITDYVHKHIARSMVNGPTGENLNTGAWAQNQMLSKSFTKVLDTSWVADNCDLIAFVYRDSTTLAYANVEQASEVSVTQPLGITYQNSVPQSYKLAQNFPNPFNPVTNIVFEIPKAGNVSLKVYDIMGREVAGFIDGYIEAGIYKATLDAAEWSSGVYFYTLSTNEFTETKKMVLTK